MEKRTITDDSRTKIIKILGDVPLFKGLQAAHLASILKFADLLVFEKEEVLIRKGEATSDFFLVLDGEVSVYVERSEKDRKLLTTVGAGHTVGEIGVLLQKASSLTAIATKKVECLRFNTETFFGMFRKINDFGLTVARSMAQSFEEISGQVALPRYGGPERSDRRVTDLLPLPFLERHQVLPLRQEKNRLIVGFVNEPTSAILDSIYKQLPGMEIQPVRIHGDYYNGVLKARTGASPKEQNKGYGGDGPKAAAALNTLLEQMVAEGASDLHLCEGTAPRWRVDGDLRKMENAPAPQKGDLLNWFGPILSERHKRDMEERQDADLGYALGDLARFRINLYRDAHGHSASIRLIPNNIMTLEQLGYPNTIGNLCSLPNGLILVTGPTGSGKSTTLAAMVDHINQTATRHIITLEDPIEFVHTSAESLINQREIGTHTPQFARGLMSAMREDPDVVLVGEILDRETLALAMETASTGHLVLATMHTNSATATIDRVADMFPDNERAHIRTLFSEILRAVITQTLCKRNSGGRSAALEIMIVNRAITNLIREGKTNQLITSMQAGKKDGQLLMNDSLAKLVATGKVAYAEALAKTSDRNDLAKRLNMPVPD